MFNRSVHKFLRIGATGLLVFAFALGAPGTFVVSAMTPTSGGLAGGTKVTVNAGSGDQTDPHVNGNLVTYTDVPSGAIRYYSFLTQTDQSVPTTAGTLDILSDVFGTRISFSRLSGDRQAIMVYDTATSTLLEVAPQVGSSRLQSALGGDNVAFVDTGLANGEIMAYNLSTSGPLVNVSAAVEFDLSPALTPAGDAIVWARCPTSILECAIMKAQRVGGIWQAASVLADVTGANWVNPDTDGTWVVYSSNRPSATDQDIYFRALSGAGAETAVELPGAQLDPTISGGVISFQSATVGSPADVYVYVIATNTLIQVTDTPTVNDVLTDVTVLGNGDIRVVWAADDGLAGDDHIYAQTFTPPAGPPTYNFSSFLQPVDNLPTLNTVKAGAGVPVKFSLGGDQGLNIFAASYPVSQPIQCDGSAPSDAIEQTVTAGGSGLSYDVTTDTYTYIWKTDKAWAGTCRQLTIRLSDGTDHKANFKFK